MYNNLKPEQERINKSCKLASTSSKEYFQTDMQKINIIVIIKL